MPIYEFECNCGNKFEIHFFYEKGIVDYSRCDKCGKFAKRIVSVVNHFWNDKDMRKENT